MNGFKLKSIHGIDLGGIQSRGARSDIRDTDGFDFIKMTAPRFPIIGIAFGQGPEARLMGV